MKNISYLVLYLHCVAISVSISINREPTIITGDITPRVENSTQFQYINPISNEEILQQDNSFWKNIGESILKRNLELQENPHKVAKNIIVFLGDGMGISTITAARIYKGQQKFGTSGEEYDLAFDKFHNNALVKTYSVDMQVPDSAATATALFTGIKTRYEALGVDVNCNKTIFDKDVYERSKVDSFMVWAQNANKDTGIVTTTRITHATPGATYAHANNRYWECDAELPADVKGNAKDIARQLIEDAPGNNFKVILGGGQQQMGHTTEYTKYCTREDGLNMTSAWERNRVGTNYVLASNNEQLNMVNDDTEYLLGIFSPDHLPYELVRDRGPTGTPSLTDMTRKALQILKKGKNGFVLMVEGGLIDQAHHQNYARLAMEEAAEFDNAISVALNETGPETLILVTADHSHSFTMEGYSKRGNDILANRANQPNVPPRSYEFVIPPLWKRMVAEFMDFLILFLVKMTLTFLLLESFDIIDLEFYGFDSFQKNLENPEVAVPIAMELLTLELLHRFIVCAYETYFLKGKFCATPGKRYMGLMVVTAESISPVPGRASETITATGASTLGMQKSLIRSALKNLFVGLFLPLCIAFYIFPHNRTSYDMMSNSIVVEYHQEFMVYNSAI